MILLILYVSIALGFSFLCSLLEATNRRIKAFILVIVS